MLKRVNDQHTTPKCYLKNFSSDQKFIFRKFKRVDNDQQRNKELLKPISLKSATVKNNFYSVQAGNEPMLVETLLYSREIENHYSKFYKLLVDDKIETIGNIRDRGKLLSCLLSMHCRTPKQFNFFFDSIPQEYEHELPQIKEEYKVVHLSEILTKLIQAHEFKVINVVKIIDSGELITSDNPVLIINRNGDLINHKFQEQFNKDTKILIPLDPKHCCVLQNAKSKTGIPLEGKGYYNRIIRTEQDSKFSLAVNDKVLESAEHQIFGREKFMKAYFSVYKFGV